MPVRKEDAQHAVELLQEYRSRLSSASDKPLLVAVNRVIDIFQSNLFNALLDIQEFYEVTIQDENQSTAAGRSVSMAPMLTSQLLGSGAGHLSDHQQPLSPQPNHNNNNVIRGPSSNSTNSSTHKSLPHVVKASFQPTVSGGEEDDSSAENSRRSINHSVSQRKTAALPPFEVSLERGQTGFGFSIAGGVDNPHVHGDTSIFITRVTLGGVAEKDGRLKVGDVILSVNGQGVVNVPHTSAVECLKKSGKHLKLLVRNTVPVEPATELERSPVLEEEEEEEEDGASDLDSESSGQGSSDGEPAPASASSQQQQQQRVLQMELSKGPRGLGFSIAGGVGNEHVVGDTSIYITKVIEGGVAEKDARIAVGDRLLRVNTSLLVDVTHEAAVTALRNTGNIVQLTIIKTPPYETGHSQRNKSVSSPIATSNHQQVDVKKTTSSRNQRPSSGNKIGSPEPMERRVVLHRAAAGLGFNIVGGDGDEGIFISHIHPGGVADASKRLSVGDHIVLVNGADVTRASHETAAQLLKEAGETVELGVGAGKRRDPDRTGSRSPEHQPALSNGAAPRHHKQHRTSPSANTNTVLPPLNQRRSMYVRALFDYDPTKDSGLPNKGLSFNYGEVLHVTNACDDEWWQARRACDSNSPLAVIPSSRRVERRERARLKRVNFTAGLTMAGLTSPVPANSGPDKKAKGGKRATPPVEDVGGQVAEDKSEDISVLSYEPVRPEEIDYTRPVIILGPLKEKINDQLLLDFPDVFVGCVPHTSRPSREQEIDGCDYHFVPSREIMERDIEAGLFIEAGQYQGNMYGTSVAAVQQVARTGRHCVLDVSGNAIKRLRATGMEAIVVFVKATSTEHLRMLTARMTEEQAQRSLDRLMRLETEFGALFTAIVSGNSLDEIYTKVKDAINKNSGTTVWIPVEDEHIKT